ncbi:MAG: hypothetical protein CMM25_05740 [Rhodospirillaceae bacterium]|nr:hypothetical protein [Rhodospirillaceae bacterium]
MCQLFCLKKYMLINKEPYQEMGIFDNPETVITTIILSVIALACVFLYISWGGMRRGGQGLWTSLSNVFLAWNSINLIVVCLVVVIAVCEILRAKIRGYYDGIYSYNTSLNNETGINNEQYNSNKFPVPYGYKVNNFEAMTSAELLTLIGQDPYDSVTPSQIYSLTSWANAATAARAIPDAAAAATADGNVDLYLDGLWKSIETAFKANGMNFLSKKKAQQIKADMAKKPTISSNPTDAAANPGKYKPLEAESPWMIPIEATKAGNSQWINIGVGMPNWQPNGRDLNLGGPTPTYWGTPIQFQRISMDNNKAYVNLIGLSNILKSISVLQWACIVLLIATILFNNFPLQYSRYPGQTGPSRTIKTFVMILGLLMAVLTTIVYMSSLSRIAEYNGLANLGNKHKVTLDIGTDKQGQPIKQDYYFPTRLQQVYPPMNQLSGWFYILILGMSIATGLAFATLKTDIPGSAYKIMKIKAGLVSELQHTGSLIAYEMRDPLFKLIDSAIAKKAARNQVAPVVEEILDNGRIKHKIRIPKEEMTRDDDKLAIANVIPRLANDTPIKLFDFVTVDGLEMDGQPIVWLVAAAGGFTIFPHTRKTGRQYYNITGDGNEESRWAVSTEDRRMAHRSESAVTVDPSRDPYIAQDAIFGNNDYRYEPDYIHNLQKEQDDMDSALNRPEKGSGAISTSSLVTLIPINKNILENMIISGEMTDAEITQALEMARDEAAGHRRPHGSLGQMIKNIITYDFSSNRGTRNLQNLNYDEWKTLLNGTGILDLTAYSQNVLENEHNKEPNGRLKVSQLTGTTMMPDTLYAAVQAEMEEGGDASTIRKPIPRLTGEMVGEGSRIKLFRRTLENHTMYSITALDLIHLRYSLVKDILFRQVAQYSGQDAEKIRQLYANRAKHFPTNNPRLLETILPALKEYVDPEVRAEYDAEVHPHWPAGYDENKILAADIDTFAGRFNEMMKIQTTPYKINNLPPFPTPAQRQERYSINAPTDVRRRGIPNVQPFTRDIAERNAALRQARINALSQAGEVGAEYYTEPETI